MDGQNTAPGVGHLSAANLKVQEPRIIKEGDTLKFRLYPGGALGEFNDYDKVGNNDQIIEVTVTAVKKAVISFE